MDKQDWEPVLQRATEDINLSLALRQACRSAVEEIERLRRDYSCTFGEMRLMMDQRDSARLQTRRILSEIDCRIEHGAESGGHLEAIRNLFEEATDDR